MRRIDKLFLERRPHPEHRVYPYLLKGLAIERSNHVWTADLTYIPVQGKSSYFVAVINWATRGCSPGASRTPSMHASAPMPSQTPSSATVPPAYEVGSRQ